MATIEEIKEDFLYIYIVELAFLISMLFNLAYLKLWSQIVFYSLVFWAIFIFEDKILKSMLLTKTKDLKRVFELIRTWRRQAKMALVFYLSLLIILSSWGIVAYISEFIKIDVIKIIVEILPFYIAIYAGWLLSLSYIKAKYTKFVLSLLKKKR